MAEDTGLLARKGESVSDFSDSRRFFHPSANRWYFSRSHPRPTPHGFLQYGRIQHIEDEGFFSSSIVDFDGKGDVGEDEEEYEEDEDEENDKAGEDG